MSEFITIKVSEYKNIEKKILLSRGLDKSALVVAEHQVKILDVNREL